ncbi:hypothetical protein AJ88_15730 [Mesorhizobium amorphae CCBAU 01583]|nr:hypothetical protein AJ88_15730 [Mesorhizobium amorphae CCBAU 01583]
MHPQTDQECADTCPCQQIFPGGPRLAQNFILPSKRLAGTPEGPQCVGFDAARRGLDPPGSLRRIRQSRSQLQEHHVGAAFAQERLKSLQDRACRLEFLKLQVQRKPRPIMPDVINISAAGKGLLKIAKVPRRSLSQAAKSREDPERRQTFLSLLQEADDFVPQGAVEVKNRLRRFSLRMIIERRASQSSELAESMYPSTAMMTSSMAVFPTGMPKMASASRMDLSVRESRSSILLTSAGK